MQRSGDCSTRCPIPNGAGRTVVAVARRLLGGLDPVRGRRQGKPGFHFDMGEMVAWSHEITFGTPSIRHLPAWLAGAWFSIFPPHDVGLRSLRRRIATVSLWVRLRGFDALSRRREKRGRLAF